MDAFLKKIEMLADKAAFAKDPMPLDPALVMARIRDLPPEAGEEDALPLRLYAGASAAMAAAAAFVFVFAASAWADFNSPAFVMETLTDVLETVL